MYSNVTCKNGTVKFIKWQGILVDDQWLGCGFDLTEQKKLEDDLLKTVDQNQRILDNLQDAYFQADEKGIITYANATGIRMLGYDSIDELIGKPTNSVYADSEARKQLFMQL